MLLAVHVLTDRPEHGPVGGRRVPRAMSGPDWSGGRGGAALVAVSLGLTVLSGGAEAIIDSGVLVLIYWAGRLVALGYLRRRAPAGAWSPRRRASCSAWPVGWPSGPPSGSPVCAFVSQSQRGGATYAFFTSGSLPDRLLTLLVSPFVLGTNQDQPGHYAGPYNFQEVTSYVGILALIAACVPVDAPLAHSARGPPVVDLVRDPGGRRPLRGWATRPPSARFST